MAETIPGGYYVELDKKDPKKVVRAHNANGEDVEILSDEQVKQHAEEGTPAPLKKDTNDGEAAKADQQAAATRGSAGKGGKK